MAKDHRDVINDSQFIKIKDMYIRRDLINFFYFDEDVLYIGVDGNILTIELDLKKDNVEYLTRFMDHLFTYREII